MASFSDVKDADLGRLSLQTQSTTHLRTVENQIPLFAHLISSPLVQEKNGEYIEVEALKYEDEREMLMKTMSESGCILRWRSEVATHDTFVKSATEARVLHFTGHGLPSVLCVEDELGHLAEISHEHLGRLFDDGGGGGGGGGGGAGPPGGAGGVRGRWDAGRPELVFVSACHSEQCARAFVAAGVPHAVGVRDEQPILDRASLAFTNTFYQKLLTGWPVGRAFHFARQRVLEDREIAGEADKFLLLPDPARDPGVGPDHHARAVFDDLQVADNAARGEAAAAASFRDVGPPACPTNCPARSPYFLGRARETAEVYAHLANRARLVTVTGARGLGKTQVALAAAAYARERRRYDRVVHVALDGADGDPGGGGAGAPAGPGVPFEQRVAAGFGAPPALRGRELLDEVRALCCPGGGLSPGLGGGGGGPGGGQVRSGRVLCILDGATELVGPAPPGGGGGGGGGGGEGEGGGGGGGGGGAAVGASEFRAFLGALLGHVPDLQVVVTSEARLGDLGARGGGGGAGGGAAAAAGPVHAAEKAVALGPLRKLHAAELFAKLMPRALTPFELYMGQPAEGAYADPLHAFAAGSVVEALGGHPLLIARVVPHLADLNLLVYEDQVLRLVQSLREDIRAGRNALGGTPAHLRRVFSALTVRETWREVDRACPHEDPARARADGGGGYMPTQARLLRQVSRGVSIGHLGAALESDKAELPWHKVEYFLRGHFAERVGAAAAAARPLGEGDAFFLRSSARLWGGPDQMTCIAITNMWGVTLPVKLLRPFINGQTAESYLASRPAGTFLVRLSESVAFSYTISVVSRAAGAGHGAAVNHVRVNVHPHTFACETTVEGRRAEFPDLATLILGIPALRAFFGGSQADCPKEEALLAAAAAAPTGQPGGRRPPGGSIPEEGAGR